MHDVPTAGAESLAASATVPCSRKIARLCQYRVGRGRAIPCTLAKPPAYIILFPNRPAASGQLAPSAPFTRHLLLADFFLCPSRFEPCGLADIEFGWLGAVQIGHNTGGCAKTYHPHRVCTSLVRMRCVEICMAPCVASTCTHARAHQFSDTPGLAGGLGKMPGFYYTTELDCTQDHTLR